MRLLSGILLILVIGACRQVETELPTLALLPTIAPSPTIITLTPTFAGTPVVGVPTPTPESGLGVLITELVSGNIQGGLLTADAVRQVFTFEGVAGQFITAEMTSATPGLDPVLTLYDPDGNPVATDDNSGGNGTALLRNVRLPVAGEYRLQTYGKGRIGAFNVFFQIGESPAPVTPFFATIDPSQVPQMEVLTPTLPTAAPGARLRDHEPQVGNLDDVGGVDRYVFFANAGERITVGASPFSGSQLIPRIELVGPTGEVIATADPATSAANGDALIANQPIQSSASYVLYVTGLQNTTGFYAVSFGRGTSRENVMRGRTVPDQAVEGSVARRGLRDVWSAYFNAGDVIAISVVSTGEGFDPLLEVTLQDGTSVISDDNSGGAGGAAQINELRITQSGVYFMRVSAAGAASIGTYNLLWRYVEAAATPTVIPGRVPVLTVADTVPESEYLFFPFQGRAGQRVEIRVTRSSVDTVLALLDPQGLEVATDDDSGGDLNPYLVFTLPADGTYTVRINAYLGSGEFELTVVALY